MHASIASGPRATRRVRSVGSLAIGLLLLATALSGCLGYNPLDEPDGDPDATPRPSADAQMPIGTARVTLNVATSDAVTIDVADASSTLVGAVSGMPGDGASVEPYTLAITNVSPTILRVTWVGGPCDSANSLSIDATRQQLLLVQPECPGDAIASDRILDLEFATPIDASEVEGFLQDGLDTSS